jgi:hypothetical protein
MTLVASTLVGVTPGVAEAQFGGLIKRVKKIASLPSSDAPHFDETVVELTPTQVDAVMRGLSASIQTVSGPNGVNALAQRIKASTAEEDAIKSAHPSSERDKYVNRTSSIMECRDNVLEKLNDAHESQMQGRLMSDPTFGKAYGREAENARAAAQRHDTAAMAKAQARMVAMMNPNARADTIAANKQCGAAPGRPAWMTQLDTLPIARERWQNQIRDLQARGAAAGVTASGLTAQQFGMAQERIRLYLGRAGVHAAQPGFSEIELTTLEEKGAELRSLMTQTSTALGTR